MENDSEGLEWVNIEIGEEPSCVVEIKYASSEDNDFFGNVLVKLDGENKETGEIECKVIIEELVIPGCEGSGIRKEGVTEMVGVFNGVILPVNEGGSGSGSLSFEYVLCGANQNVCQNPSECGIIFYCDVTVNDCSDCGIYECITYDGALRCKIGTACDNATCEAIGTGLGSCERDILCPAIVQ